MARKIHNPEEELFLRVKAIMVLRVVFLTGFVALIIPFQQRFDIAANIIPLSVVIGAAYFLTAVYALFLKLWRPAFNGSIQVLGDLGIVGGIIYTTGGIHSPFSFLFLFVIIATSVVLSRTACYLVASGASIIYGLLIDLEYFNVIYPIYLFQETNVSFESGYVFYIIFLNIASFYSVAYLSSILSNRLRVMREELAMASMDLRELQAFHSSVVQDMGNGLLTTDLEGRITSLNQAAEDITGYPIDACLGEFAGDILDLPRFRKFLKDPTSGRLPMEIEDGCNRQDGKRIIVRMKVSRFTGHGVPVKGYICVFEDLTEVKEIQEKYYQAQQLAAVGRFSAGLAHEIRNPLASLSGSIQVLSKGLVLTDSYRKLMEIVLKEADRLNVILTEFLNYSQPRRNQKAYVDLTQIVQDRLTLLKNSEEYHPSIKINYESTADHVIIDADEEQIKQLVWNLCLNALQAMPKGGELTVALEKDGDEKMGENPMVQLTVRDQGCGIPGDQLEKVFDPFYTTKANGVGLGLANVYQIVQQSGGSINVESEEDQGTRFIIEFPPADRQQQNHYSAAE
jgi:two-component system sensor histidine kinase PilS (NtrC family)